MLMICPKLKLISYNCKGISETIRSIAIRKWLGDSSIRPGILCLQEIKANGFQLDANLRSIRADYHWFTTVHDKGRRRITIAITNRYKYLVTAATKSNPSGCWVALYLKSCLTIGLSLSMLLTLPC